MMLNAGSIPQRKLHSAMRTKKGHVSDVGVRCVPYECQTIYYLLPTKDVYNLGGPHGFSGFGISLHVFGWYPIGLRFSYTSTTLWVIGFRWAITQFRGYRFWVGPYRCCSQITFSYFFQINRCPAEDYC